MRPRVSFAPMRRTFVLASMFLLATLAATTAEARRPRPGLPPPQPAFQWDSRGRTMLGEQNRLRPGRP